MKAVPQYQSLYVEAYDQHNVDRTLAGRFLQKSHQLLESTLPRDVATREILEVGAGSGHHYNFIEDKDVRYILTDASDEMLAVSSSRHAQAVAAGKLVIEKQDASRLSYADGSFDRLIATHVLEHMPNPVAVLQEWNRVVRKGGLISLVLPCDPGMAWRLGRHFGPRKNATRLGLPYDYVQAADHVNAIYNLVVFIRYHFEQISELWYPARIGLPDINLFYVCHVRT